jgi:DNA-binding CsgD family transcriptional regulator
MQLISVPPSASVTSSRADERAVDAMAGVVACIGSAGFANEALAQINRWMPISWLSVFRLYEHQPPRMPASGSYHAPDGTVESWEVYRSSLYREDQTFLAAREQVRERRKMLVHWHAREIAPAHRERIYTRHGLRERLSVVCRDKDDSLLAINLYRHEDLPVFTDEEIEWVGSGANLLTSCVQRHLELVGFAACAADAVFEGLTRREREVCERMLKGWTYDGIAMDLGVSAGTVKTYRDRAFDRLGIHHRNELFALMIGMGPH